MVSALHAHGVVIDDWLTGYDPQEQEVEMRKLFADARHLKPPVIDTQEAFETALARLEQLEKQPIDDPELVMRILAEKRRIHAWLTRRRNATFV
jgi:hypothetical protein